MGEVLFSTTILASFLGGFVALLAPCCVSVMLPAYFASTFRRRTQIAGMTLVFAAGVATVILPIALGATALSRLVTGQHEIVFTVGGLLMIAGGAAMLAGWKVMLPMPAMRGGAGRGMIGSVYVLGAFSGAASACCAPVLAGVVAISGAAASFGAALTIGVAYVFGMVAPLAALALVWDRRDWGSSRLLAGRTVSLRLGRLRRTVPLATALSGGLLVGMGALTIALAVRGPTMGGDWQVRISAWLDHAAAVVEDALSWVPGWMSALAVFAALAWFVTRAVRGRAAKAGDLSPGQPDPEPAAQPMEKI